MPAAAVATCRLLARESTIKIFIVSKRASNNHVNPVSTPACTQVWSRREQLFSTQLWRYPEIQAAKAAATAAAAERAPGEEARPWSEGVNMDVLAYYTELPKEEVERRKNQAIARKEEFTVSAAAAEVSEESSRIFFAGEPSPRTLSAHSPTPRAQAEAKRAAKEGGFDLWLTASSPLPDPPGPEWRRYNVTFMLQARRRRDPAGTAPDHPVCLLLFRCLATAALR